MDSNGYLYYGLEDPCAIQCWDSRKPFTSENIETIAENEQTLQFVSGMKVIRNKNGNEELWTMSCRFQVCSAHFQYSMKFKMVILFEQKKKV